MPVEREYSDSVRQINDADRAKFKDSQEALLRRLVRQSIRKGDFTRSQRDVMLAFLNHWFHHKSKGAVHPGRAKLAKKAGVSVRTVASALDAMRKAGAIEAVAHLNGLHGNATDYTVDLASLFAMCGAEIPGLAVNGVQNCTGSGRAKIAHRINNVVAFPCQEREDDV